MKKRYAFIATAFAALLFASMTPATAFADPSSPEELQEELDDKNAELEKVIEKYNGAKEDLEDTQDQIDEIEDKLPELQDKADQSREVATNIAVNEYTRGRGSNAGAILSGSPDSALQRMSVLGSINASQAADLAAFGTTVQDLEDQQAELKDLKADQKDAKDELADQKDDIESEVADLEAQQQELGGGGGGIDGTPPAPSGSAGQAVQFAYDQGGEPYVYGAAGPDSWDCSGLTMMAWDAAGYSLSHQTNAQWDETTRIGRDQLEPGDLVFYNSLNHVAIYVGDGMIVHAPQSGQNVQSADIDSMAIDGYGRVG